MRDFAAIGRMSVSKAEGKIRGFWEGCADAESCEPKRVSRVQNGTITRENSIYLGNADLDIYQ